jgi:hypothetical protein
MATFFGPSSTNLKLETRKSRPIANDYEPLPPDAGTLMQADAYKARFPNATHRLDTIAVEFNCHGLTFGARRTQIRFASEVQKILDDDGYKKIPLSDILPGDIAIWRNIEINDYEHSGIIVDVGGTALKAPLVLSKWGKCQEVVHNLVDCPYDSPVEFYRVRR